MLQYGGFHATQETRAFREWLGARNVADFRVGLSNFDVGSPSWAYADREGNRAFFQGGELPLRRDLELGTVHGGVPPAFIRDGSGPANLVPNPAHLQGQAIPYEILPAAEMPLYAWFTEGFDTAPR